MVKHRWELASDKVRVCLDCAQIDTKRKDRWRRDEKLEGIVWTYWMMLNLYALIKDPEAPSKIIQVGEKFKEALNSANGLDHLRPLEKNDDFE